MNLYRAIAFIRHSDEPELVVFFEARPGDISPSARLLMQLSAMWQVPLSSVEVYNVYSEHELLQRSDSPAANGDARLFETGHGPGGQTYYAELQQTLFLVRPITLERLMAGQFKAMRLHLGDALDVLRQLDNIRRGVPA